MIVSKLKAPCLDCRDGYIAIFSDLENKNELIPTVKNTTIYCKHMNVCPLYNDYGDEDLTVLAPLRYLNLNALNLASEGSDHDE